jgi:thiamine pyrophosphokinase
MGACVIFCAGDFAGLAKPVAEQDLVIAADGGLVHARSAGVEPDVILGDFDSLGYVPEGSRVYPVEKDDTDAMLAVRWGLEKGCRDFVLYGGLDGPRLDHTIANLQTLCFLAQHDARGALVGLRHTALVIKEEKIVFSPESSGIFSVFCLGNDADATIRGAKYAAEHLRLTASFPLGVSNHFVGDPVEISAHSGTLIVLYDTVNGFPTREALTAAPGKREGI